MRSRAWTNSESDTDDLSGDFKQLEGKWRGSYIGQLTLTIMLFENFAKII